MTWYRTNASKDITALALCAHAERNVLNFGPMDTYTDPDALSGQHSAYESAAGSIAHGHERATLVCALARLFVTSSTAVVLRQAHGQQLVNSSGGETPTLHLADTGMSATIE